MSKSASDHGVNTPEIQSAITFLRPFKDEPARKKHRLIATDDGHELETIGYGDAFKFHHSAEPVGDIAALFAILSSRSSNNEFAIRGSVVAAPGAVIRRIWKGDSPTIQDKPTPIVAVDLDKEVAPDGLDRSDILTVGAYLRSRLPNELQDVSCVIQLSGSYGLDRWKPGPVILKARLWFLNQTGITDPELRRWFKHHNKAGLSATMDPAVAGAGQPIYTAAPIFEGMDDPVPVRLALLQGSRDTASITIPEDAPTEWERDAPPPAVDASLDLDDTELLTKASAAKNGAAFDGLWAGDLSAHNSDHSAADMALLNALAFWTGKDAPRMDRLFRQSGLMRPKWDVIHDPANGRTYGQMSVDKALADCREVYSAKKPGAKASTAKAKVQPARGERGEASEDTDADMPGWFADGPDGPITPEFDKHHPRLMRKFGTTQLLKNHYNAVEIAENAYPGLIGYNEFRQRIEKRFDPPWGGGVGQWTDRDTAELACKLSKPFAAFSPNVLGYAVMTVAYRHPFNPAQDRLRALADQWDGESRIDGWLVKYLGAQVNASNADYLREISAAWIKGVAARVLIPGCKRDDVLVLCGKQGVGKSTAAQHLSDAIQPDSFTDNLGDLSSKDSRSGIRGIIIAELGELAALGKSDIESIKTFVATRSDHFREAYGKGERDYPRTVSFIGTTNNPTFLIDPTGNRRWWPVTIGGPINIPRFTAVIPQLLGEAAARVLKGERWHVTDEAATEQADNVRAAHFDEDIWTPRIKSAVADLMAPGSTLDGANTAYVCIPDILNVIGVRIEQQNKVAKNRVGSVLRQMKFTEHRNRKPDGDRFRTWYPPFCPATPDDDGSCGPVAGQKEASQTAGKPVSPASPATIPLNKLNQLVEGCGRDDDSPHGEDDTDKIDCFSSHIGKVAAHAAHAGLASQIAASEPGHNWDATISSAELRDKNPPPVDTIDIALARAATAKPQPRKDLARIAGYPKLPDLDQRIGRLLAAGCLAPLSGGLVAGGAA